MQSLANFFEDNKPLAYAALVAAVIVLIFVVLILYRLLFGRRLRAAANGRTRQPRLGIVDAYDLDRQRQLVLVRRDNVEHLVMIGGPTDVVIESTIVRAQPAAGGREKDVAGPLVGALPPMVPGGGGSALPASTPPAALPPAAMRLEPASARPEASPRAEPSFGSPPPAVDRSPQERAAPIPERTPPRIASGADLAPAPAPKATVSPSPVPRDDAASPPPRAAPPRPAPARPAVAGTIGTPDRAPPRPSLPPRPPLPRTPLPPRPSLAASLPPRPTRPAPPRPDAARAEDESLAPVQPVPQAVGPEVEPRIARGPEETTRGAPAGGQPSRSIESLESLEDEMAKLLGRPTPRRDG